MFQDSTTGGQKIAISCNKPTFKKI